MPRVRPYKFLQGTSRTPTVPSTRRRRSYKQLQCHTPTDPPIPHRGTSFRLHKHAFFTDDTALSDTAWVGANPYDVYGEKETFIMEPVRYTPVPGSDTDANFHWRTLHLKDPGHFAGHSASIPTGSHFESTTDFTIKLPSSLSLLGAYNAGTYYATPSGWAKTAYWRLRVNGTAVSGPHDVRTTSPVKNPFKDNPYGSFYFPLPGVTHEFVAADGITIDQGDLIEYDVWYSFYTGDNTFGGGPVSPSVLSGFKAQLQEQIEYGGNKITMTPGSGGTIKGWRSNVGFDPDVHTYELSGFGGATTPGSDPFKMVPGTDWYYRQRDSTGIHLQNRDGSADITEIRLRWDRELAELYINDRTVYRTVDNNRPGIYYRPDSSTTTDYYLNQTLVDHGYGEPSYNQTPHMGLFDGAGAGGTPFALLSLGNNYHQSFAKRRATTNGLTYTGTVAGSLTVKRVNI